jgi:phosphoserine phosphatase RsbU/P
LNVKEKKLKMRILIADDEASLLRTMAFTLKRKDLTVDTVNDGRMAYDKIFDNWDGKDYYDLLITDIEMPGLSGLELIKNIRKAEIEIPILAITGFGDMDLTIELMRAGCNDYLDKPFCMQELIDRVSGLLGITANQ